MDTSSNNPQHVDAEVTFEDAAKSANEPSSQNEKTRHWSSITLGVVVVFLGAGGWFWTKSDNLQTTNTLTQSLPEHRPIVVMRQAVSQHLDILGAITAAKSVAIVAPFDGVIREKSVQLGEYVDVGDVLAVMDTSDVTNQFREAQSGYIKAAMAADAIAKWDTSPDVTRARRALVAAENVQASIDHQVEELKVLLEQGIVSRNEHDGVVQQQIAQRDLVAAAQDDLNLALARGNDESRQLIGLELENAQSRLKDVKQQLAGAKIATAVAGIVTQPTSNGVVDAAISIEPGATVSRGAAMFLIAETSTLVVAGVVDEIDINRVNIGQKMIVTSDAFPGNSINGKIISVSSEASAKRNSSGVPVFEVRGSFSLGSEELRHAVRIGMSARMTIETYSNASALIVPPSVIIFADSTPQVKVRRGEEISAVTVQLGNTYPEGVEIISGVEQGDVLIAP
jgi:multidrug efflux pump subunit AcrA (membrane-fusion protein)